MNLITVLTSYFPEIVFISETKSCRDKYAHKLRLLYLPESDKSQIIQLLFINHIDENSYITTELMNKFEKDLLIQIVFSLETDGKIVDNNGKRIWNWADIRKQLKPIKNLY